MRSLAFFLSALPLLSFASDCSDHEVDAYMMRIVEQTMRHLPIVVDDQAGTTSMFYETGDNTLIYGIEVSVEGGFSVENINSTRDKAHAHASESACQNEEIGDVLGLGVTLHYRYHTAQNKIDLFSCDITIDDCGVEV